MTLKVVYKLTCDQKYAVTVLWFHDSNHINLLHSWFIDLLTLCKPTYLQFYHWMTYVFIDLWNGLVLKSWSVGIMLCTYDAHRNSSHSSIDFVQKITETQPDVLRTLNIKQLHLTISKRFLPVIWVRMIKVALALRMAACTVLIIQDDMQCRHRISICHCW